MPLFTVSPMIEDILDLTSRARIRVPTVHPKSHPEYPQRSVADVSSTRYALVYIYELGVRLIEISLYVPINICALIFQITHAPKTKSRARIILMIATPSMVLAGEVQTRRWAKEKSRVICGKIIVSRHHPRTVREPLVALVHRHRYTR